MARTTTEVAQGRAAGGIAVVALGLGVMGMGLVATLARRGADEIDDDHERRKHRAEHRP